MTRLKLLSTAIATAMLLCLPPARQALASVGGGAAPGDAAMSAPYR